MNKYKIKMGSQQHILRKILVISFDDGYLKDIGEIITKKRLQSFGETGYINYENKNNNLIFTLLSNQIKIRWYHHYAGAYGAIIINEGNEINNNMNDLVNILNSDIMQRLPLLFVYDKKKIFEKDNRYLENLRYFLYNKKIIFNVIYIDFKVNKKNSELLYGLDWLYKQIMKIT